MASRATPAVQLQPVDEEVLERLVSVAVAGADPVDAMPPAAGPSGWTPQRVEAFRDHHRARLNGFAGPHREVNFAVLADGEIVGSARLARHPSPKTLVAGMWLARTARGRGIGGAVLRALLAEAKDAGAATVVAETSAANTAALSMLRRCGARLTPEDEERKVRAELRL